MSDKEIKPQGLCFKTEHDEEQERIRKVHSEAVKNILDIGERVHRIANSSLNSSAGQSSTFVK